MTSFQLRFARPAMAACALFIISGCNCSAEPLPDLPDAEFPDALPPTDAWMPMRLDGGAPPLGCEVEVCSNGLDEDCDGNIDEECGCIPGESQSCFTGPVSSRGLGACGDGVMVCNDGLEFGAWGACEGVTAPGEELCDPAEVDEDCDGAANEGCECTGSEPLPCGSDVGACGAGLQECIDGLRGDCIGATEAMAEECNGIDDDCDGLVDEALTQACGSDVGECSSGTQTCLDGTWEACAGSREPADESCDLLDNDCDGMIDEGLTRACGSAVGACMAGTQTCDTGAWSMCTGETGPMLEDCNGADDDCDGMTDESLTRRCGSDLGVCTAGTETCASGAWGTCAGEVAPGAEACDGTLDEDCDGLVDEGCDCVTGRTRSCGSDVGVCAAGTETCDATGAWGTCIGAVSGSAETCNGTDDDCDGATDEGLMRACGTDTGSCRAGTETCSAGSWGTCGGSIGPAGEVCDGMLDEDCDGLVDEGCACTGGMTRSCGTGVGACVAGTETCDLTGSWGSCMGAVGAGIEDCDGVDDDCDGFVDEGLTRGCGTDIGVCSTGTETCSFGSWGSCAGSISPGVEICDGVLDQDCDGTVDEGCGCTDGSTRGCGSDVGACSVGSQLCSGGSWGTCAGDVGPGSESCNGIDDDCDGVTDESLTRGCGSDIGVCVAGTETCSAGAWGSCAGSTGASSELCDGALDQDCDGLVDEGCSCTTGTTRSCGTSRGECVAGTETCDATGNWGACLGSVGPTAEVCDDLDNDCDRSTDESLARACGTDVGACMAGTETCSRGAWGSCTGSVGASTELCDGATDEDCDTLTDEGCACTNGDTRSCGTAVGACVAGTETCDLTGTWGTCLGATGPATEICDMLDNDCDGAVDEGTCITAPPLAMCPSGLSAEVLATVTLSASGSDPDGGTVSYAWTVTSRPVGSSSTPASPTSATTSFFLDAAGTYEVEFCVTDDEGDSDCCTVTVISTPPGVLHVEIQWDEPHGDVDLHLLNTLRTAPDGWFTTDDCHFANIAPDWGPAGAAANPTLDVDDRDGYGPENITIDVSPASGTYDIGLHYYCDTSAGGTGPVTGTVRIYCMGALVGTYTGVSLSSTDDWVTVATVDWPSCAVRRVNRSSNGTSLLPASFTSPRHCEVSCSSDGDCPTGERCVRVGGGGPPRNACILM